MYKQPGGHSTENPDWKCCHKSGPDVRNLVVCIDGTSNQFGQTNTNVIELYDLILKEAGHNQLTWYNSGIGTYARPSWKSFKYYRKVIDQKIDLAIAWNFERTVLAAYRWLSETYQEGDRIFLFGFSRGAFQVRVLAAMIHKVGLILKGNEEQIPFAYELYADPESDKLSHTVANVGSDAATTSLAARFKRAFSHDKADVHYVGAWDTVSSIGLGRGKFMLPGTIDGMKHVCYFRHALALDERRVKFLPEYAYGGTATRALEETSEPLTTPNLHEDAPLQTLEVWFAGTHSDIGGENTLNGTTDRSRPPLRWMVFEATAAGLRTKPFQRILLTTEQIEIKESLKGIWWLLECLPLHRLTYTRTKDGKKATHKPHLGSPRKIHQGQKIHGSLIRMNSLQRYEYTPRARPPDDDPNLWFNLHTKGLGDWKVLDLFERTQELWKRLVDQHDKSVWGALRRTAMTVDGRQAVYEGAVGVLLGTTTSPSIKLDILVNLMDVLTQTRRKDAPLRLFDLEMVRVAFDDCDEITNDPSNIHIIQQFLGCFTTFEPYLEVVGSPWSIPTLAVFPDGTQLAYGMLTGTIQFFDFEKGTPRKKPFHVVLEALDVVAVSPNGRIIASGSRNGRLCLWNAETGVALYEPLEGHTKAVASLAFSPDGKWVASGSGDSTVRIWDVYRGIQAGEPLKGHISSFSVYAVKFSKGGQQIVSSSNDRTIQIWDFGTRKLVKEALNLRNDVEGDHFLLSTAFSSDGSLVAAGFSDKSVYIWNLEERRMVGKPFRIHDALVSSIAFSPDNRMVASGSTEGTVHIWDVETQILQRTFEHGSWVRSVSFFPDGKYVASGCDDGLVRIWAMEMGMGHRASTKEIK